MSAVLPQRVPSTSPFYQAHDVLESNTESDLEPPRGRKRRRSSAASLPAQQMSTLRGRGRHRSLSPNQEVNEVIDNDQEDLIGSESSLEGSREREECRDISMFREVIADVEVYHKQRPHLLSMELSRALQQAHDAVAAAETELQDQSNYQHATNMNSNLEAQTTNNETFYSVGIALLEVLQEYEAVPELKPSITKLQKATVSPKKPSTPNHPVMNDRPHTKKRRSQSPSRSKSDDKPRRRQRTRSRSRSHGLGKNSHA